MKHELATAALWAIAMAVALVIVGPAKWSILGPVSAVCMFGSTMTVRAARVSSRPAR